MPTLGNIHWSYNNINLFMESLNIGGSHRHEQPVRLLVLRLVLSHLIQLRKDTVKEVGDDDLEHGRSIYPSINAVAEITKIGVNQLRSKVVELFITGVITAPVRKGGIRTITETSQVSKACIMEIHAYRSQRIAVG